ncbi:type VI secretion system-associated protein TagF [Duganella sp. FT3S]|uniref:Type VI secretion system-associated protein TagF n=1 Tax=Rugamonas fusca TaxID=2758568 RepID=A0A7W2I9C4_9BURK|nr:type VI secretion system-associated protein TagF [Rugamonas fusca]MBA5608406.1 type VI secretion system-associated protein TagF [Rugamonas fusca]
MKRAPQATRVGYFGKIPTRSDFIKAVDNPALAALLDQWLAEVMNLLTLNPRWKQHYDALRPLPFAFVGNRSRRAIAGHILSSGDQSQRRYPFLVMSALEVHEPAMFLARSPLVLAPLWEALAPLAAEVPVADDPAAALHALAATVVELDPHDPDHETAFTRFLDGHDLASLQAMLANAPVRQILLALGLLLQPVKADGQASLDRSLALPLPNERRHRYLVAAFWLDLMRPFLRPGEFELCLFFADLGEQYVLVVGFNGAAPETLQAVIDPQCVDEQQITLYEADWVEQYVDADQRVHKLAAYLEQGQLSLRSAHALFHETFA